MAWDYETIAKSIRNTCTRQDISALSNANLLSRTNNYYKFQLTLDLKPIQLKTWYEFTTTNGTDEYDLKRDFYDEYVKINPLAYFSADAYRKQHRLNVYYILKEFYDLWVEDRDWTDSDNTGKPQDVLIYENQLLFRRCPDDTYYISIEALRRPLVYIAGGTSTANIFANNDDIPEVEEWGQLIVYGTSKQILQEAGDIQELQRVAALYSDEVDNISYQTADWLNKTRAKPRF